MVKIKGPKRAGKADLEKHLNGIRLNKTQAIRAKCYDCNGMGDSGECDIIECSLFPYSPYGGSQRKRMKRGSEV